MNHKTIVLYERVEDLLQENNKLKIDCKQGCHWCCALKVDCFQEEAENIANFISTSEHYNYFFDRLVHNVTQISVGIKAFYDKKEKEFCAFLLPDNTCGIYEVRPLSCRTLLSPNRGRCKRYYNRKDIEGKLHKNIILKARQYIKDLAGIGIHFSKAAELQTMVLTELREENE